jgi:glycosyltransferase involved in cell wall biosynthesis
MEHDSADGVVRAGDLTASPFLRRLLRRPPLAEGGGAAEFEKPAPALLTRVLVPDPHVVGWVPNTLRSARWLARERAIECVITSSPPESTHLVGLALARGGVAWLADLRDGWSYEPLRPAFPTSPQRRFDAWLERRVLTRADGVLAATTPIADDVVERFGRQAVAVRNAWDPDLDAAVATADPPPLEPDTVTLVHTGTLSGSWGRDPRPLLEAIARLAAEPEARRRLRVVLAGRPDTRDLDQIRALGLSEVIRVVGNLSRPAATALQRRADALVLVTSPNKGEATGKLFEYLAAGRPIVALAEGNEAERIVKETGAGVTVPRADVDAIASALRRVLSGDLAASYAPHGLEEYRYPAPAERVAEEVERALANRSR